MLLFCSIDNQWRSKSPCRYLQVCMVSIHTNWGRDIRCVVRASSSGRYKAQSYVARDDGLRIWARSVLG